MAGGKDGLARFNALPIQDAERELLACCAAPRWARQVTAGRPYPDMPALTAAAGAVLDRLSWADVATALAAHPQIGERPTGEGRDADWSRREQATVAGSAALSKANRDYEDRFGHVFLVFASGRDDTELLAEARLRLGHDEATERRVVRTELGKIAQLRLTRLLG